jgi:hypothetical protein
MPFDGRWVTGEGPAPAVRTWQPVIKPLSTSQILAALPAYLLSNGWTEERTWHSTRVWRLHNLARIVVPPPGLPDSPALTALAVSNIADAEGRRPGQVLHDLAEAGR